MLIFKILKTSLYFWALNKYKFAGVFFQVYKLTTTKYSITCESTSQSFDYKIDQNCGTFTISFTTVKLSNYHSQSWDFHRIFFSFLSKTFWRHSHILRIQPLILSNKTHSVFCRIQLLTLSECKQWSKIFSVLDIYMFFQNRSSHFWCFTSTSSSEGFLLDGRKSGWISSSWRLNVQPNKL